MSLAGGSSKLLSIEHVQLFQPSRAKAETAAHHTLKCPHEVAAASQRGPIVLAVHLKIWAHWPHTIFSMQVLWNLSLHTRHTSAKEWRTHKLCCTVVWKYLEFCFHFMVLRLLHRKSSLWPNESWALTFLFKGLREGKHSILVKPSIS